MIFCIPVILVVISPLSFLILYIQVLPLSFLMNLAKGLSILFVLSKKQLFSSLIFSFLWGGGIDFIYSLFFYKFIYLFIQFWLRWVFVAERRLSLVAVSRGYSSLRCMGFSLRWLLFAAEHRLQVCVLQQLWHAGSRAQAQQLWCTGLVAPWHVGSSQTRDRTRVPCIGRWILNHCTTREVPISFLIFIIFFLLLTLGFVVLLFLIPLDGMLCCLRFFLFLEVVLYLYKLPSQNCFCCTLQILESCVFMFTCLAVFSDFFLEPLIFFLVAYYLVSMCFFFSHFSSCN